MPPISFHFSISEVAPYINWLYFFHAWGLPPQMASLAVVHPCSGCRQQWLATFNKEEKKRALEAMGLYDDAQALLKLHEGEYQTHARFLLLEAYSQEDDVWVCKSSQQIRLPFLRQQTPHADGCCYCLSDYIRPKGEGTDHIGLFASSTDRRMEETCKDDTYQHLLHQTLADRLAEATAERLHQIVRTSLWGYAPNEHLTIPELFQERYQGCRPAIGYPSLPDQSMTFLLDDLLNMEEIGITLTENGGMSPHASTCGFMFAHPQARHFSVGHVAEDQLKDYALRRAMPLDDIRKFMR